MMRLLGRSSAIAITTPLTLPRDDAFICPVLIGRHAQLATLEHALESAAVGHRQTLLLGGEAGVGKSRLVAHARRRASQLGFRVVQGQCFEQDRPLPYAPFIDLLRSCFFNRPAAEIAGELGATGPELIKLLPELAATVPGLTPTPPLDDEREKRRIFQALEHFCAALATAQPLLLVVEDLHWSDDASLEFLARLTRRVAGQPLALLLTYRNDEAPAGLWRTLATLDHERLTTELVLQRMPLADVDSMLRALLDQPHSPSAELSDAIYALTDGNPFFAEEVVKSLSRRATSIAPTGAGNARLWPNCVSRAVCRTPCNAASNA